MAVTPDFDIQQVHNFFSTECFNKTWDYIEMGVERSADENLQMLHTAITSLWHWSQRADVTPENLSVGYWQVSRVYCLLKQPHNARAYGLMALKYAEKSSPFYKGYAYETLARAEMILNNHYIMKTHLERAQEMLRLIEDEADKQLLARDLESIR